MTRSPCKRSKRLVLWALLLFWLPCGRVAEAQESVDPRLLAFINQIKAVDNHTHALPVRDSNATPTPVADPLGTSPPFFSVRQRETNPEWIEAWRALCGYRYRDAMAEHVREAFSTKQRLMQEEGVAYPASILDKAGIDVVLINAARLGRGQSGLRFRWVPYADGFLFPFPTPNFPGNPQRHRASVGLAGALPAWSEYLASVTSRLQQWKTESAVAVKFTIAYYRSLDFAPAAETDARAIYERYIQDGGEKPRDYRNAEYSKLQDFLFRHIAREAGRAGIAVHISQRRGRRARFRSLWFESAANWNRC